MSGDSDAGGGSTYNTFSGNAGILVQAGTIAGGLHLHVERPLPPISTRAFAAWLVIAAVPLTGALLLGQYGAIHVHEPLGLAALAAATLAALLAVRIGTVVWEWWTLSRDRRTKILQHRLAEALRGLAQTLSLQWENEERLPLHRLQDPNPLPVRWVDATGDNPDLAGTFEEIADTFDRVPSRRLVILGEAGSGKSVLARRFALSWLTRECDGPRRVPVILSLSTWNPAQGLRGWVVDRLVGEHPALGRRTLSGGTIARELLDRGHMLPVLDGFDEIAGPLRAEALRKLNQAFNEKVPVVLTSRPEQYWAAVKEAGVAFSAAAVVRLCPLDAEAVRDRLLASTIATVEIDGRHVPKWQPVLDRLAAEDTAPAAQALTTPLMVALARLAYSDDTRADPAELLDADRFADRESVEQHLLDRLVPVAYASLHEPGDRIPWGARDAGRWLAFLARRMNAEGTQELAWWRLAGRGTRQAAGAVLLVLVAGLVVTMAVLGYADGATDILPLWGTYLLVAPVPVIEAAVLVLAREAPVPTVLTLRRRQRRWLLLRLVLCAAVGLPLWSLLHIDPVFLTLAALVVLIRGVPRAQVDLSAVAEPLVSLRSDRRASALMGPWHAVTGDGRRWRAAVVLLAPLASFWLWSQTGGHGSDLSGQWWLLAATTVAVLMAYGLVASAWGQFQLIRCVLAARGLVPRRLLGFLADAHRRGVLRQTGGVYQFRHAKLQDRLAGTVQRPAAGPVPAQRGVPVYLSLACIFFGVASLTPTIAFAPGVPGPYLRFAPVCDELQREMAPWLSEDAHLYVPTGRETPTEFYCTLDTRDTHGPHVDVSGYLDTASDGRSAIDAARDGFTAMSGNHASSPPTPASCGGPVEHTSTGTVDALCGNAEFDVYIGDDEGAAELDAAAVTVAQVAIGIALGGEAPAADNADARRAAVKAMADKPRLLASDSGSARYRPGAGQAVTGAVWQSTDSTAMQDVGPFVFRTPRDLWCGSRTDAGPGDLAWECGSTSQNLSLDLAAWPCPDACAAAQLTRVEQDWESYVGRRGVDYTGVSWRLSDPQTAYAETVVSGRSYQLLLIYAVRTGGRVRVVAAAARADATEAADAQKIVNDIRAQAQ